MPTIIKYWETKCYVIKAETFLDGLVFALYRCFSLTLFANWQINMQESIYVFEHCMATLIHLRRFYKVKQADDIFRGQNILFSKNLTTLEVKTKKK